MLGWLGVQHATSPFYAFSLFAPPLLLSPIGASGGIDPHELGHLIPAGTLGPRRTSLAEEAFATAMAGAFGHALASEICVAYGDSQNTTVDVTPQTTAHRKTLLLLARAMHDALNRGADSMRFFADGRWTRPGAEWRDLASLLGVPADSLFEAAQRNIKTEVAGCRRTGPRFS